MAYMKALKRKTLNTLIIKHIEAEIKDNQELIHILSDKIKITEDKELQQLKQEIALLTLDKTNLIIKLLGE